MRGRFCPGILVGSALVSVSCNGTALCRSEVVIAFAPTQASADLDAFAPGVQVDLRVETTLFVGDLVTLEVRDPSGASLSTTSRTVGADRAAVFDYVTVPTPRAVLHATGGGICGRAEIETAIDVAAGNRCALGLAPAPDASAFYAPLGVLSAASDLDPVAPGLQAALQVATQPGWTAELIAIEDGERSLGAVAADAGGAARLPVALADGTAEFRAVCRGGGGELQATPVAAIVDTAAPRCALIAPAPGSVITWAWDLNGDPGDGLQLKVAGRSSDLDVAGEPVSVTIVVAGGAPIDAPDAIAGEDGTVSQEITLLPGAVPARYDVALTMRDHAGNACIAVASYLIGGR
ncbi:MAG TPA: hypothetical protein VK607_02950 [Kofleriaceae bacterium]|nr:hypothetical protein [Kofleriaceae bacterium]